MNSEISLGRLRTETESCRHFLLTYKDDPLTPASFSVHFDQIAICLSASPYIAFKKGDDVFCLSHIKAIKRYGSTAEEKGFILICNDYSASATPISVRYFLKCR